MLGWRGERKKRSVWFRELVENCVVYGDRGYRGCEVVIVCDSREMRAKRQVVEGIFQKGVFDQDYATVVMDIIGARDFFW